MKKELCKIVFSIIFSCYLFALQSQAQQVKVFNAENSGLPNNEITAMAIDAQGKQITTIEGLSSGDQLHPVSASFVANDAQQCGFCTPGFVMASKALLDEHPHPTPEQAKRGLSGNLCRCGTYHGMQGVMAQMAAKKGA